MQKAKIVWNGCDSFIYFDEAVRLKDYETSENRLHKGAQGFDAFEVEAVDPAAIPIDDDGEMILESIFVTEDGKFWK